ncbi:DEAD/DEAH box helicase [archaeon]|nr:MAG: DEAD/DEAH box helicase [archaeon]
MVKILESMQITRPSKIQATSFRSISEGKHCVIGDQTGSGKTLAYLLPTLQRMDEALMQGKLNRSVERSPYIVIVTPTTELAS